jgi:hypothetical protein
MRIRDPRTVEQFEGEGRFCDGHRTWRWGTCLRRKPFNPSARIHNNIQIYFQLSDLHISGSYTLGPATIFTCPSASRIVAENGTRSRRVYSVIEQSPGVKSEDHGRTVWMWDDKQSYEVNVGGQEKRSSITVRLSYVPFKWPST